MFTTIEFRLHTPLGDHWSFLPIWPSHTAKSDLLYEMRKCVFIDITNIFVNMTDFSCHFNQKDTLCIPNECLCVILTYYFLLCSNC